MYPKVRDLPEYFEEIEKVSKAQIDGVARKLLQKDRFRLVVIGKEKETGKLEELIVG